MKPTLITEGGELEWYLVPARRRTVPMKSGGVARVHFPNTIFVAVRARVIPYDALVFCFHARPEDEGSLSPDTSIIVGAPLCLGEKAASMVTLKELHPLDAFYMTGFSIVESQQWDTGGDFYRWRDDHRGAGQLSARLGRLKDVTRKTLADFASIRLRLSY